MSTVIPILQKKTYSKSKEDEKQEDLVNKGLKLQVESGLNHQKGVEKGGYLGVKMEGRIDWEVDSCLTGFELKVQAEGIGNELKMTGNIEAGLTDMSEQERLIWKSAVQARAHLSIPHLPWVGVLLPQGKHLFSRGEKQEEIRSGFQFRNLIKSQLLPSNYPW